MCAHLHWQLLIDSYALLQFEHQVRCDFDHPTYVLHAPAPSPMPSPTSSTQRTPPVATRRNQDRTLCVLSSPIIGTPSSNIYSASPTANSYMPTPTSPSPTLPAYVGSYTPSPLCRDLHARTLTPGRRIRSILLSRIVPRWLSRVISDPSTCFLIPFTHVYNRTHISIFTMWSIMSTRESRCSFQTPEG